MGTSVSVQRDELAVEPGSSVTTELRVRNTSDVVDQFAFQPLGDAAAWITVEPPIVRLFPATDEVVQVTIAPPRDASARPGPTTWAVKAVPQEDPGGAAVAEGTVDVGVFFEMSAELQPVTARGRLAGRYELAIDNRGNVAVPVRIAGTDAEQALVFDLGEPQLDCAPGSARFTKLKVRPPRRIWRGQPVTHPFELVVEPQVRAAPAVTGDRDGDADASVTANGSGGAATATATAPVALLPPPGPPAPPPVVLTGVLLQEPILPRWLLKAVLALLALALVLFVLWKTLLKPRVESAAREVAVEELSEVADQVEALDSGVAEAAQQAEQAQQQAAAAQEAAAGGGGGGGLGTVFNETTVPTNFRLAVSAGPGSTGSTSGEPLPTGTTFALTDLILQNPSGDVGRLRVLIDGEVAFESALENFRDLDFHFVAPYLVDAGEAVSIEVDCAAEQVVAGEPCDDAASFAGFTTSTTTSTATSTATSTGETSGG